MNTQEVLQSRVHIKMLAGDYPCQQYLSFDRSQDPTCLICRTSKTEDMVHLLSMCRATGETRARIIPELLNTLSVYFPTNELLVSLSHAQLTQFILDPTSLNLPQDTRISPNHPALHLVLTICRKYCFAVHKDRARQLKLIRQK